MLAFVGGFVSLVSGNFGKLSKWRLRARFMKNSAKALAKEHGYEESEARSLMIQRTTPEELFGLFETVKNQSSDNST